MAGVLAVPTVAWTVARLAGLEVGFPGVALMAYTPYAAVASVVPLAVSLLLRQWLVAVPVALAVACLAVLVLPRGFGGPDPAGTGPEASGGGPVLRVLTSNMLVGGADPESIVDLVRTGRVDLLATQEYTPQARQRLAAAGLERLLPHQAAYPLPGVVGSALYSRFPLTDAGYRNLPGGFGQAYATLHVPGAPAMLVESAHPAAPATARLIPSWRADLAAEPPATPHGPVRVLLGDFNSTLDHVELRRLVGTGYRDAASVVGAGLTPTWPYNKWWPKVTLDHVLADTRIGVRAVSVHQVHDSDHRAVLAELALPAPGPG
ncbi:MAG: endonuclease/exonuclease/phosphatase family protein [Micromonosporaceae bacterium]|nr:endonuclease/exonuclease/phosphatase family protein [Micromonosporaceae bacterium]